MELGLPDTVRRAILRLRSGGFEAWAVGGCVRDLLLGKTPTDYDLATSALPPQTEAVFSGERVIETGLKHGTVTVLLEGMPLEITTYRVDQGYSDGRHPDAVRFTADLTEDLARRDFTVNAMALSPEGDLRDPFGGQTDLTAGRIRCVGDPIRRFTEDALRILRALRFSSALGFSIEGETLTALRRLAPSLSLISAERIRVELDKLLCGPDAGRLLLEETEALGCVLPELLPMRGFDQRNPHHCYDVLSHCVHAMESLPPEPKLRWAGLLHDVGKPDCFSLDEQGVGHFYGHAKHGAALCDALLRRLRFDNESREHICALVREHDRWIEPTESAVRKALSKLGEPLYFDLLRLKRADVLALAPEFRERLALLDLLEDIARRLLTEGAPLSLRDLAVKGEDLAALGIPRSPEMGNILRSLLDAVLEGRIANEKAALLAAARGEHNGICTD